MMSGHVHSSAERSPKDAHDVALADAPVGLDPQPHEDAAAAGPAPLNGIRIVAIGDPPYQPDAGRDSAPAAARTAARSAAAGAGSRSPRTRAGSADRRRALRRIRPLSRDRRGDHRILHRDHDLRLGRDDRRRFTLNVLGRSCAFLLLSKLGLRLLDNRRRRGSISPTSMTCKASCRSRSSIVPDRLSRANANPA